MEIFIEKIINPEKFKESILISKIVAGDEVYRKGVEIYKKQIKNGKKIKAIVVIKHPKKDLYAVLDGHHRFYALRETGIKKINCAVIKSPWEVVFNRTEHGLFQPSPAITKYIRVPYKKLTIFLNDFIKDSEGLIKKEVKFLS